ncbi:MAG: type I secretion system permease/ATPase [Betaproteobacteria bacterium]
MTRSTHLASTPYRPAASLSGVPPATGLLDETRRVWPALRRAWLFSLIAGLLVLAPSVYMLEVYERVVNSRSHATLLMLTLAVVLAYAVMEALEWVRAQMLLEAGREADRELSPRLFDLVFQARRRRMPGGNLQPMSDWRTLRDFLHAPFLAAVMELPVALVFLVLVFMMSPWLGALTLASAVLQVTVAALTERSTQPPLTAANRSAHGAQQFADGALRNAEVVEAMGMHKAVHARWIRHQREFLALQARASLSAGGYQAMSKLIQQVLGSALLGLSAWLLLHNQLNGGPAMMIVSSIIGGRVLAPLVQMVQQWKSVVAVRDAWSRLDMLMTSLPAPEPAMALPAPKGLLTVEQLVASAPTPPGQPPGPVILKAVQFALQPGEALAVIGPSAAGKSTLARLLVGLWPASQGKVRLDGADVYAWDKTQLGPHLGYLPQDVELFEGTVAENIARFGEPNRQLLGEAVQAAGLEALVAALPGGLDTPVGRDGAVLSGGQRQRIALARALYGWPSLVVLDEPNASLDEAGDAALLAALAALKQRGATVVLMTHRQSVLGACDRILLLVEGQQQAFGPRDEVLAALLKAQAQAQAQARAAAPTGAPSP